MPSPAPPLEPRLAGDLSVDPAHLKEEVRAPEPEDRGPAREVAVHVHVRAEHVLPHDARGSGRGRLRLARGSDVPGRGRRPAEEFPAHVRVQKQIRAGVVRGVSDEVPIRVHGSGIHVRAQLRTPVSEPSIDPLPRGRGSDVRVHGTADDHRRTVRCDASQLHAEKAPRGRQGRVDRDGQGGGPAAREGQGQLRGPDRGPVRHLEIEGGDVHGAAERLKAEREYVGRTTGHDGRDARRAHPDRAGFEAELHPGERAASVAVLCHEQKHRRPALFEVEHRVALAKICRTNRAADVT